MYQSQINIHFSPLITFRARLLIISLLFGSLPLLSILQFPLNS